MASNSTVVKHIEGWVSQPNGRGTQDILWTCFFTIFVCTWTVLHLNVPAQHENHWQIKMRKAKWMTAAIIVPEVVTASAFVQRVAARNSFHVMQLLEQPWSMSHAFYFNMGAAWLQPRDSKPFPINAAQLSYLIAEGLVKCPNLTEKEIWDRSKADKFAKLFACFQIAWLLADCIGRTALALPVTPLEIATIAFAVPSIASFAFWFYKPRDIEVPTFVRTELSTKEILLRISPKIYAWRQTPLDFIENVNGPSFTTEVILKSEQWPGRSRFLGPATRIRNDVFALKYSKLDQLLVVGVWAAYAGTHFSAWNYSFPSRIELLLWRVSSIIMASSMFIFWITGNRKAYLLLAYVMPWRREKFQQIAYERAKVSVVQILLGSCTAVFYLAARLCLIGLALSCLRSLPVGAYRSVNWLNFWP